MYVLSKYANATQPTEKSLNYVIPIILLVFFGLVYAMSLRADNGFVSFILIGIALVTIVYWTRIIKRMVMTQKPKFTAREQESKNWVYDLIKGDDETVFVAEVPGPEDKIAVRLIDGVLYIRGSQGFSKEVQIEVFIKIKRKAELEAFSKYGLNNITEKYLPKKLEESKSS